MVPTQALGDRGSNGGHAAARHTSRRAHSWIPTKRLGEIRL